MLAIDLDPVIVALQELRPTPEGFGNGWQLSVRVGISIRRTPDEAVAETAPPETAACNGHVHLHG